MEWPFLASVLSCSTVVNRITSLLSSPAPMKTTLTPHLRISPYKGSVATVQIQMPFHAIVRSWTSGGS